MANAQFILKTTIWDGDFRDLTVDAQNLYKLLGSQKSISLCGVIALGIKRWSSLSKGNTPKRVRAALEELANARWVIVDEDTEEVLVRTYITHAGSLKMPNVVVGVCRDYTEILSEPLRRVVMAQIRAEHLVGIRNRKRIPAQFIAEYEHHKGEPFPLTPEDDPDEPSPEGMPITNGEPFREPQGEPKPIQPTTDTTDNRQPTTDISKSSADGKPPTLWDQANAALNDHPRVRTSSDQARRGMAGELAKAAKRTPAPMWRLVDLIEIVLEAQGLATLDQLTNPARAELVSRLPALAAINPAQSEFDRRWKRAGGRTLGQRLQSVIDGWYTDQTNQPTASPAARMAEISRNRITPTGTLTERLGIPQTPTTKETP